LRRRRPLTVSQMAEECGVTTRTIYRDIDTISQANYPIYYDGGYRLLPTGSTPPPQFTGEEQNLLRSALDSWPLAQTKAYRTTLRRIQAKLDGWQNGGARTGHDDGGPTVRPRTGTDPDLDRKLFDWITQAISSRRRLDMTYDSITSGKSRRRVDPYFLVFRGRAYYLVGFCHRRESFRMFRLGRIKSVSLTRQPFERDPKVSLERLFKGSWEVYLGTPFEAVVRFRGRAARVLAGGQRHASETIKSEGTESLQYTVMVNSVEEFGRWVLGYGGDALVLSPPALARWVRTQARETLAGYRTK
jgi:predicted DNA-binding transcriptional regulator YafY